MLSADTNRASRNIWQQINFADCLSQEPNIAPVAVLPPCSKCSVSCVPVVHRLLYCSTNQRVSRVFLPGLSSSASTARWLMAEETIFCTIYGGERLGFWYYKLGRGVENPQIEDLANNDLPLNSWGALQKLLSAEHSCFDPAKYLSLWRALWTSVFKVKHTFMCLLNWGVCLMQVFGGWAETLHGAKWNLCSIRGGSSWLGLEVE